MLRKRSPEKKSGRKRRATKRRNNRGPSVLTIAQIQQDADLSVRKAYVRGIQAALAEVLKRSDRCVMGDPNTPTYIISKIQEQEAKACATLIQRMSWKEES